MMNKLVLQRTDEALGASLGKAITFARHAAAHIVGDEPEEKRYAGHEKYKQYGSAGHARQGQLQYSESAGASD